MNKALFSLIGFIAALFLLSGCTTMGYQPQGDVSGAETVGESPTQVSQVVSEGSNIAEQMRICEEMTDGWSRTNCLESVALTYEIPTICAGLADDANCYTQMAAKYNKPQYCQLISTLPPNSEYDVERCISLSE